MQVRSNISVAAIALCGLVITAPIDALAAVKDPLGTNADLVYACTSQNDAWQFLCTGYMKGFLDTMRWVDGEKCPPPAFTQQGFLNEYVSLVADTPKIAGDPPTAALIALFNHIWVSCTGR